MEDNKRGGALHGLEKMATWVLLGAFCAGLFVLGYFVNEWTTPKDLKELEFILDTIEAEYMGEFDREQFIKAAIDGSLDEYSYYYTPDKYADVKLNREGVSKARIGLNFYSGSNVIHSVAGNSPAESAGIMEGGVVTGIKLKGDEAFTPVSNHEEFSAVYDRAGTGEITLEITYGSEIFIYTVTRSDFYESYVWYQDASGSYGMTMQDGNWVAVKSKIPPKTQIKEGFAYIKMSSFNGKVYDQMQVALEKMKASGITKLVFDLRNNGGGYMSVLTKTAGLLIPGEKKQCVSLIKYKSGKEVSYNTEDNKYDYYEYEAIYVLANSGTASASEALIGAMLDYDALSGKNIVKVVLEESDGIYTTYGKGIMQTTYEFRDTGSAIKLTTAEIYWPVSKINVHGKGIRLGDDARVLAAPVISGEDYALTYALSLS